MIVVDVETSGTDPQKHSLVSIGAIDFSHPEKQFYEECRVWDGAHINPEALGINGYTEAQIKDLSKKSEGEILQHFFAWIEDKPEKTIAAQNPLFDLGFLQAAAHRNAINYRLAHRSLDLHSVVYFHMIHRGLQPPIIHSHTAINSDFIMEYVGIPPEPKPHIAINGAKWESEAFSRLFYEKSLFDEFKKYPIPWKS